MSNSHRNDTLQCHWNSWRVIGSTTLALDMPKSNYCDMVGAISIGQDLMPNVAEIQTFVGGDIDTIYIKSDGGWRALLPILKGDLSR